MLCDRCGTEYEGDSCPSCTTEKTPYYRKRLDQGKARDQFTVEVNAEERRAIESLKARWDIKSDSVVLKLCLENAINGGLVSWSEETWRYMLSVKRQRLSNITKLPEVPLKENARQIIG